MAADLINKSVDNYSLLDVGCRTMDLKPLLTSCREYLGGDLIPGHGVVECNLEKPLPFSDKSFDVVTALDVLEHLDDPHTALKELLRVARNLVVISLPNMYYFSFRFNFLVGKGISGKYTFPAYPVVDRHRWILSYSEAIAFIKKNTLEYEVVYKDILPERGRTKWFSVPLQRLLAKLWPNLFVYGLIIRINTSEVRNLMGRHE
jgi:SAM-dependent methyltransferase